MNNYLSILHLVTITVCCGQGRSKQTEGNVGTDFLPIRERGGGVTLLGTQAVTPELFVTACITSTDDDDDT